MESENATFNGYSLVQLSHRLSYLTMRWEQTMNNIHSYERFMNNIIKINEKSYNHSWVIWTVLNSWAIILWMNLMMTMLR